MIDSAAALEAVIRHATELEDDYDDIAPVLAGLAACGDTTLVPRLHEALDRFLDEQNFYGRDLIAGILAGVQGVAALPVLLRASARDLGDDQDSLTGEIIDLLHTNKAAARRTVLGLATGGTPELRRAGLWALGFVVEAQDVELLLATAATDADPRVRSVAIGSIPNPAGGDRAFQVLVTALRDRDDQVRISAISRLGYTGLADAVASLAALAADPVPRVRSMVAYALGQLRKVEATPALLRLRHDPDRHVRENAHEALGSIGGAAAVDALLLIAADKDPLLRAQAARALARAVDSDPRIPAQLTTLMQDDEPAVRAAIISGLTGTDSARSRWAPLVVGLANDPAPVVRQRVAAAARRLVPDATPDILHQYISDADPTVRRIAGMELARLTDTAAR
ncbi:HEAT repeat domain-containing protein [Micromonospora echinaurantiaca]|uniref:HEAT repeat domain-containing protein n=1 Tax=Micromonospora echinaurantiaca TaxID=47857 RepID=UPI00378A7E90